MLGLPNSVSYRILSMTHNYRHLVASLRLGGVLPRHVAGKALHAVGALDAALRRRRRRPAHLVGAARLPAAATGQDAQPEAGEAAAAGLRVRPPELVEVLVEGGYREAGPEVVGVSLHRAEAGAGAVLGVGAPEVLGEPVEGGQAGRQLQLVPPVLAERHGLLLAGVAAEHEVGVAPRGLGRVHLEGVVLDPLGVRRPALPVPLGQSPQQSRTKAGIWRLLQPRHSLLLLLGFLGVLDDSVPVERGPEVDLEDGGELVRVDEVDDGDGAAQEDAENPGHQHQPEAPPEGEDQHGLLHPDEERHWGQQLRVEEVAEEQDEAGQADQVGAVPRDNDQQQVRQQPQREGHPANSSG